MESILQERYYDNVTRNITSKLNVAIRLLKDCYHSIIILPSPLLYFTPITYR